MNHPWERFWRVCVSLNKVSVWMSQRLPNVAVRLMLVWQPSLLSFYPRHPPTRHISSSCSPCPSLFLFCSCKFTPSTASGFRFFFQKYFPEVSDSSNIKRVSFRATSVPTSSSLRDATNNHKQRESPQSINVRRNLPTS